MRKALYRAALVAQFPVAIVDGRDRTGAHDLFEVIALQAGDFLDGFFKCDLNFRKRRQRHPDREVIVQYMVFTHVGVRQNIVAELLAVAQSRAVTKHQPGMRAKHRDMVGNGFGIGWADTNIDHCDTRMVCPLQVISGHLGQALERVAVAGRGFSRQRDDVARLHKAFVTAAAFCHQFAGIGAELVHIELVVGEKHEVLEMRGTCRRIMRQPMQRIIDALGGEWRKRHRFARCGLEVSIDDLVIRCSQIGYVEQITQRMREGARDRCLDIGAFLEGEMDRDWRRGFLHRHGHTVIAHQKANLLVQVMIEQIGARDVCGIIARRRDVPISQPRIHMREAGRGQTYFRIIGAVTLRRDLAARNLLERVAQEGRVAIIEFLQGGNRRTGIGENLRVNRRRCFDLGQKWMFDSLCHGLVS